MTDVGRALEDAHRCEWAYVLAATVRVSGSLDIAEECVQDAFVAAIDAWERDGIPNKPGAWLTTTARRRALDVIRRERTLRRKLPMLVGTDVVDDPTDGIEEAEVIQDDRLRLVFTCCHPALSSDAQVALTLRLVCGLSTAEIARAFLVSEATMAARITRAKKKIAIARIPYRVPPEHELPERLDGVLSAVHLLFTTGHTAPSGDSLTRSDLARRAVDLARVLIALMPDEREAAGLLALLLLTDARRPARVDDDGRMLLLEDQDRSRWDQAAIAEGRDLMAAATRGGVAGRYGVQAAIAAAHSTAATYEETDWPAIRSLYDALLQLWPSPVVALNRAVAVAFADGPEAGLEILDHLADEPRLKDYLYLASTRADLLRRLGRWTEASDAYVDALRLATNDAEGAFLSERLAQVSSSAQA